MASRWIGVMLMLGIFIGKAQKLHKEGKVKWY